MFNTAMRTIDKYDLIQSGDKIVVSLSGGPDSTALLFFLADIRIKNNLEIYAVHINHMIRGEEADSDERFVREYCASKRIELLAVKKDVPKISETNKISLEEAGRIARHEACAGAILYFSADKVATGHNKNDNAETFLMRLSRGAGAKGLSGIRPASEINGMKIIRPLIECTREQIEEYCSANKIPAVTDSTNKETLYTRNKVRLTLIPWLKDNINGDIVSTLAATSEIMAEQSEFMERLAKTSYNECLSGAEDGTVSLDLCALNKSELPVRRLVIREALKNAGGSLKDISKKHIDDILSLSEKGTGKKINLPGKTVCATEYGRLVFGKEPEKLDFDYLLMPGIPVYLKEEGFYATFSYAPLDLKLKNLCTKMFKCDKILFKLNYRTRKPGDRLKLPGGTKKLSDFFIDNKTTVKDRNRAVLITDGSDVLSVLNVCDSEKVKEGNNKFFIQFWEAPNGNC